MFNKEPRCLHISCHGVENSAKTLGVNYNKDNGHYLLLESETHAGELVSSKNL